MSNQKGFSKVAIIISLVFIIFVAGGGVYGWQVYEAKKTQDTLQKQILQIKKEKQSILEKQEQVILQAEKEKMELEQKYCKGAWKNGVCVVKTCVDSDVNAKPKDIFIKGGVTYTNENGVSTTVYDSCSGDGLSGGQVNEGWCFESPEGSGNYIQGKVVFNCNNGCMDGACRQ